MIKEARCETCNKLTMVALEDMHCAIYFASQWCKCSEASEKAPLNEDVKQGAMQMAKALEPTPDCYGFFGGNVTLTDEEQEPHLSDETMMDTCHSEEYRRYEPKGKTEVLPPDYDMFKSRAEEIAKAYHIPDQVLGARDNNIYYPTGPVIDTTIAEIDPDLVTLESFLAMIDERGLSTHRYTEPRRSRTCGNYTAQMIDVGKDGKVLATYDIGAIIGTVFSDACIAKELDALVDK